MEKLEQQIVNKIESLIDLLTEGELDTVEKARIKGMIQGLESVLMMMNK
jgi:predicted Zn-dependent peptidase